MRNLMIWLTGRDSRAECTASPLWEMTFTRDFVSRQTLHCAPNVLQRLLARVLIGVRFRRAVAEENA